MTDEIITPRADQLEELWAGEFGNAYLQRNQAAGEGRGTHWRYILDTYPVGSALELGCTQGDNLLHFLSHVPPDKLWGLDVNPLVLARLSENIPGINAVEGIARELPFDDRCVDLVLTVGLLIHIPDASLQQVMAEMVRTSARYVYCGEYHSDIPTEIRYRDRDGILFKRSYGTLFREWFPELTLVDEGYLTKEQGFDRVTWHLFERQ